MSEIYAHDAPGPHLIRDGRLEADTSRPFVPEPEVAAEGQVPGDEPGWIVPLAVWKTSRATLRRHRHLHATRSCSRRHGVWRIVPAMRCTRLPTRHSGQCARFQLRLRT